MSNTDHIVMDMLGGNLICLNCGGTYYIPLRCPLDMWIAQRDVFVRRHSDCEKTWTPPSPVVIEPAPAAPPPTAPQQMVVRDTEDDINPGF